MHAACSYEACSVPHVRNAGAMSLPWPQDVTGRFNERLVLSLASCAHCLMMDDELNVLPTSRWVGVLHPASLARVPGLHHAQYCCTLSGRSCV